MSVAVSSRSNEDHGKHTMLKSVARGLSRIKVDALHSMRDGGMGAFRRARRAVGLGRVKKTGEADSEGIKGRLDFREIGLREMRARGVEDTIMILQSLIDPGLIENSERYIRSLSGRENLEARHAYVEGAIMALAPDSILGYIDREALTEERSNAIIRFAARIAASTAAELEGFLDSDGKIRVGGRETGLGILNVDRMRNYAVREYTLVRDRKAAEGLCNSTEILYKKMGYPFSGSLVVRDMKRAMEEIEAEMESVRRIADESNLHGNIRDN